MKQMMKTACLAGLVSLSAMAAACTDEPATQIVTGALSDPHAVAVRAVDANDGVAAVANVRNGHFALALPIGHYRVEVLSANGVKHLYARDERGLRSLTFNVCQPGAPWDVGQVTPPTGGDGTVSTCNPQADATCMCDPSGVCTGDGGEAPGCDPTTDPGCGGGGGEAPGCDPTTDPGCGGGGGEAPGCDPTTDPSCWGEPTPAACDAEGNCSATGALTPSNPPTDFGCEVLF